MAHGGKRWLFRSTQGTTFWQSSVVTASVSKRLPGYIEVYDLSCTYKTTPHTHVQNWKLNKKDSHGVHVNGVSWVHHLTYKTDCMPLNADVNTQCLSVFLTSLKQTKEPMAEQTNQRASPTETPANTTGDPKKRQHSTSSTTFQTLSGARH